MIRVQKKEGASIAIALQDNDQAESFHRRGRRSLKQYSFDDGNYFDALFVQVLSPVPVIPQIVEHAQPGYPGKRLDHNADAATL